jgi:hypothetical protein
VRCCGRVPQHGRAALPQVPALFHNVGTEASAIAKNRLASRVGITIVNCIGNYPSLFLQRIYREILLKIVALPRAAGCARRTALAESHCPLPPPLPAAGPFRTSHRSKYAM